jgi:uncharacterized protein YdeI (BOF family)
MVRKIVLGTLLVGLIGVLVLGAVIRTMDKTGKVAEAQGQGYRWGADEVVEHEVGQLGQGRGGYGQGGAGQGAQEGGQGGYRGQGRGNARGDQTGTGQAHVDEWLMLQGTVVRLDEDALVVQTDSGEQVSVENRAWWFAQEQGFSAQVGDQVTLVGFYEGDDSSTGLRQAQPEGSGLRFEVGKIEDATNGQTVLLRDENGQPMWAGRGRRGV